MGDLLYPRQKRKVCSIRTKGGGTPPFDQRLMKYGLGLNRNSFWSNILPIIIHLPHKYVFWMTPIRHKSRSLEIKYLQISPYFHNFGYKSQNLCAFWVISHIIFFCEQIRNEEKNKFCKGFFHIAIYAKNRFFVTKIT